jgi:hypothetical protein
VEELKLVTRIKTHEFIEEGSRVNLKLYVFNDEHKLCRKVKLAVIHIAGL